MAHKTQQPVAVAAEWVELGALKPWVDNPRNNEESIPEVMRSIERFGFASPIIARRADGEIIAGHTRWAAAQRLGLEKVPVRWMDLSLTEARALALADNRVGEIARWDDDKLTKVIADLQQQDVQLEGLGFADWEIASLLDPLEEETPEETEQDDADAEAQSEGNTATPSTTQSYTRLTASDVPDAVWPTDNDFGIPLLDINMMADAVDQPFTGWGSIARSSAMTGTYHFYVSDDRMSALWSDPSTLANSQCVSVVEPNFSTSATMPRAAVLWTIYKKRWLARWWQSKGIRTIVDVNVNPVHFNDALWGVPKGWRTYATRMYAGSEVFTEQMYSLCVDRAGGEAGLLFLVYGGGKGIRDYCATRGWLWIPEMADLVRGRFAEASGAKLAPKF